MAKDKMIRVPADMVERAEKLFQVMKERREPQLMALKNPSRTSVLRIALAIGLSDLETDHIRRAEYEEEMHLKLQDKEEMRKERDLSRRLAPLYDSMREVFREVYGSKEGDDVYIRGYSVFDEDDQTE